MQAEQPLAKLETHPGVERAEGLVEKQDARLDGERARERHALPLAARELRRAAAGETIQLDAVEELVRARDGFLSRNTADTQAEDDVFAYREMPEERITLENETDAPLLHRRLRHVLAVQDHAARVRLLEPRDEPQDRRLAGAGGAQDRRDRARGRGERDARDGRRTILRETPSEIRDDDAHREISLASSSLRARSVTKASSVRSDATAKAPVRSYSL